MPRNYQQTINFTNKPEQVIEEFNFVGGLVTDAHETKLQPNQSPNMENVIFNTTGSIKTRNGYSQYNTDRSLDVTTSGNTSASDGSQELTAVTTVYAQTFKAPATSGLTNCSFYLGIDSSGMEQYIQVELWSTDSGVPNIKLANGNIKNIVATSETEVVFQFREAQTLTADSVYALVLRAVNPRVTTSTVNTVNVYTNDDYADGGAYSSTDGGNTWTAITDTDFKFTISYRTNRPITGLIRFYGDSSVQQTLVKDGETIYRGNDQTGAFTAITMGNGITPLLAGEWDYTVANGTLLLVDGSNKILKYRGSTNAAYTTGTISVTNGSATVTGSGTSWSTSTNAQIGEYIQLPDSKWYRITGISSNTSLTIETTYGGSTESGESYIISPWGVVEGRFKDSTGDSEAVTNLIAPAPDFIENHINRIWTLKGNSLRFSTLDTTAEYEHFNDWDTASNAGQILIPAGDGDSGTGLYSLNGALYIFQRHAIWRLYGNSPGNFELRNITNETGLINRKTLVEYEDYLIFQSADGLVLFDGSNTRNISNDVVSTLVNSWANQTSPAAILWDNKYLIAYTPAGGSYNSEALYFDLARGIFGKMTGIFASVFSSWNGGTDDGRVMFGSSTNGIVYRWDSGNHDAGYPITTIYDTPSLSFGSGMNDKSLKRFYLQQLALGDWDMDTTMTNDLGESTTSGTSISLTTGDNSLWGVMKWGDNWASVGTLVTTRIGEYNGLGKYFKFRFEQTGYGEGFEILGMTAMARARRLR